MKSEVMKNVHLLKYVQLDHALVCQGWGQGSCVCVCVQVKTQRQGGLLQARRKPSSETESSGTYIFNIPVSRKVRNVFLLFKLLTLGILLWEHFLPKISQLFGISKSFSNSL